MTSWIQEVISPILTKELKGINNTTIRPKYWTPGVSFPGFTYTVTMDGTYSASSTQPQTQPPAGADVVDLMEQLTVEMDPVSV